MGKILILLIVTSIHNDPGLQLMLTLITLTVYTTLKNCLVRIHHEDTPQAQTLAPSTLCLVKHICEAINQKKTHEKKTRKQVNSKNTYGGTFKQSKIII